MSRRMPGRFKFFIGGTALGALIGYYLSKPKQLKEWPPITSTKEKEWPPRVPINLEYPGPINDAFPRKAYYASYNRRLRHPNWVFEHLTKDSLQAGENVDRKFSKFLEDPEIPAIFNAKLVDYFKSGYDRGHMAPAADAKTSQEALNETFYLTNIAPQVGNGFNRDYWAFLEEFCRRLVRQELFTDVYVFTGPAYLPKEENGKWYVKYQLIGDPPNVSVPTHYFKVILAVKEDNNSPNGKLYALGCFLLPNQYIPRDTKLTDYLVPLNALERATGLRFFENLQEKTVPLCEKTKCALVPPSKWIDSNSREKLLTDQGPKD
ncbi:mitochondrial nuclease [Gigaspora margarita]|uniref:Endonuclease n=1 Tax=Gigaspora margarita TaxID=4874 RepID=A0A8H3X8T2_GIGMA|nr:mitochondrial nuclease [Gigaspora margarita]